MCTVGFLIAAAIIFLILMLKLSIRVSLTDDVSLKLCIGIFKIGIFPKKEKKLRLSDYKIKKFRKLKEKQRRKQIRAAKKALKKKSKKASDKTNEKVAAARRRTEGIPESNKDIMGIIGTVAEVAKTFIARLGHHLRIRVKRFRITVAADNAADTAVLYGAVCGAVQCFLELISSTMHLRLPENAKELEVVPDFTTTKLKMDIDVAFSFRIWQLFDMLIRSGISFLKKYIMNK